MLWVLEELSCPQFEDGRGAQWRCAGVESNVFDSTQATVAAIADKVAAHQQSKADEIQLRERATHVGERRKCFQSPSADRRLEKSVLLTLRVTLTLVTKVVKKGDRDLLNQSSMTMEPSEMKIQWPLESWQFSCLASVASCVDRKVCKEKMI